MIERYFYVERYNRPNGYDNFRSRVLRSTGVVKLRFVLALFLVCIWAPNLFADQEEVYFAIGEWAPYTGESLPGYGVASEIVSASCSAVGLRARFDFYPWKRAERNVLEMNYFGTFPYKETVSRSADFFFSKPLLSSTFSILINLNNPEIKDFAYTAIEDLRGFRVGIVAGTEALKDQLVENGVEVQEVMTPEQNVGKLATGRIDFYIDDKAVLSQTLNTPAALTQWASYRFKQSAFGERNEWKIMVSKKYPGGRSLLDRINNGLGVIMASGEYHRILEQHGLTSD